MDLDTDGPQETVKCKKDCSGEYVWFLFAGGIKRKGCYECGWCEQVEPVIKKKG